MSIVGAVFSGFKVARKNSLAILTSSTLVGAAEGILDVAKDLSGYTAGSFAGAFVTLVAAQQEQKKAEEERKRRIGALARVVIRGYQAKGDREGLIAVKSICESYVTKGHSPVLIEMMLLQHFHNLYGAGVAVPETPKSEKEESSSFEQIVKELEEKA